MSNVFTSVMLGLSALLVAFAAPAAAEAPVEETLEQLVHEAMAANLELAGADSDVAARLAALDQARARYLPVIDLNLRYSAADGGRTIEIPVGDLMNPVYGSLNTLLAEHGQTAPFSPIANTSIPFLREREQESVIALTQSLYDGRIGAATRAAKFEHQAARFGRDALAARLRRDVQQAYLRWLGAGASVSILEATLEAARENERVNDSLYRNGRVTRDALLRAQADLLEVEQQLAAAAGTERVARNYVNLLRDQPLESALPEAAVVDEDVVRMRARLLGPAWDAPGADGRLQESAVSRRHELRQVDAGLRAAAAAEDLARAAYRPRLALAVNAGVQGEEYGFTEDDRFAIASLVLQFNLFRGGADRAGLREARARSAGLRANRELLGQTIRLEVLEAARDFDVATASLRTAAKRVDAAQGAFDIARRKRDVGQISPVEFIDARRALTSAQLGRHVYRFQAMAALAELEYAIGASAGPGPEEDSP